jgi:hypothetical protein
MKSDAVPVENHGPPEATRKKSAEELPQQKSRKSEEAFSFFKGAGRTYKRPAPVCSSPLIT